MWFTVYTYQSPWSQACIIELLYMISIHTPLCQTQPSTPPEESLVSQRTAGMRLHHKEKCLVLRLDTGLSLPSKLNELCPCLEDLQKHRTALLINPVSQMC